MQHSYPKSLTYLRLRRIVLAALLWALPVHCAFCIKDPINPNAVSHLSFCAQYYRENKLVEAEARCRLAREYAPKFAEPVNLLGLIAYTRGQVEKARELYKEAIALKRDFAEAYNNLGAIYLDERNFRQAADNFKEAIVIDPGFVNARVNLGLSYYYLNRYDAAQAEYIKCLELEPQACDCRSGLGLIGVARKDLDEAKLQFQRMVEICPDNPTSHYQLCRAYYDLGQCGNAVESCLKAVALKADFLEARKNLTAATACLALEDQAIKQYLDKIAKAPGNAELHFNLGLIYFEKQLLASALSEFLNAIKLDPQLVLAYYQAAKVYDAQLRADDTISNCQTFIDKLRGNKHSQERDWCINRVRELQYQDRETSLMWPLEGQRSAG